MLDLHPAEVHDTMTFYEFFRDEGEQARQDAAVGLPRAGVHAARRVRADRALRGEARRAAAASTTADGKITLEFAECIGACDGAPACLVNDEHVMNVTPEKADAVDRRICEVNAEQRECDARLTNPSCWPASTSPTATRLEGYRADGGYATVRARAQGDEAGRGRRRRSRTPGLRGRGGAGFPCGLKWTFLPKDHPGPIYLCVNADESEPCTYNNRILMEKDPHQVLEGIMLACYAIKSPDGVLLHPLRVRRRVPHAARRDR